MDTVLKTHLILLNRYVNLQQNSDCFMASLEITSLFTNIPLDETAKICSSESFDKTQCASNLD